MFQLPALTPFMIIATTIVVLMLVIAFYRNHKLVAVLSVAGLILAIASFLSLSKNLPYWADKMIYISNFNSFYILLTLSAALLINIISIGYFQKVDEQKEEYYILFQVAILGTMVMVSAQHFAAFFMGLELLSIPLYAMISYTRNNPASVEAAIKYIILSAASSSILLFGIALIYSATGTMNAMQIVAYLNTIQYPSSLFIAGLALIIAALAFKLGLAPFHIWTPDVYQGASSPVTAFLASVSKGGAFAFVVIFFTGLNIQAAKIVIPVLTVISALSMFTGNLLALRQNSMKRLLACSSIAHFGYLLIPVITGGFQGMASATFYLSAYFITTVGAFAIISILSSKGTEIDNIDDFRGLYFRNKWLAVVFAAMIFSLAGMPLTAGFMTKFYIVKIGVMDSNWLLIWLLIINSAIGLFYYLKVVFTIFKPDELQTKDTIIVPIGSSLVLAISFLIIIWIGVAPNGLLKTMQWVIK